MLITNIAKVIVQLGRHIHCNICIMARADCMMVHSARKNIVNKVYGSRGENSLSINPREEKTVPCDR